jgi:hypothetical protein
LGGVGDLEFVGDLDFVGDRDLVGGIDFVIALTSDWFSLGLVGKLAGFNCYLFVHAGVICPTWPQAKQVNVAAPHWLSVPCEYAPAHVRHDEGPRH